jgi:hypothetical protein
MRKSLYVKDESDPNQTNIALNVQKAANAGQTQTAVLYYRFNSESVLVPDTHIIEESQGSSFEYDLVNTLIAGPSSDKIEMMQVINPDTQLVSITANQDYIYITLSNEFIQAPSWAGSNWENDPQIAAQVYLSKRLAMYSIVNTITESTEYTKVQLYVDINNEGKVQRVTRRDVGLIGDGKEEQPLEPMTRNSDIILTPYNSLQLALSFIQDGNYEKNYLYTTDDLHTGAKKPAKDDYLYLFSNVTKSLINYTINPNITVSNDGQSAVAVINYQIKTSQGISDNIDVPVMLYKEKECWKVAYTFFQMNFGAET